MREKRPVESVLLAPVGCHAPQRRRITYFMVYCKDRRLEMCIGIVHANVHARMAPNELEWRTHRAAAGINIGLQR